ncbi:Bax inhibitor-1/YccA family protein [Candidatus Peregrinibacteria bacterium]|nr:Bax inhibitor-1/YccA family protein [Candidatus Peregrinibacteria bacterium]MBT4056316.1 Bax inhibitor-1/YccA family protein [Candidatus Peregrinibacteria bacterium]
MFNSIKSPQSPEQTMGKNYSMTFFGKVMAFFTLAIAASLVGTFVAYNYLLMYFVTMPWLMWALFAVEIAIIFTSKKWREHSPLNKIIFASFAFLTGLTIAPLIAVVAASYGGVMIIIKALSATVLTFAAAALFGWRTEINLSGMRGFLMIGIVGLIITGVLGIFFPWGNTMELVYSGFGVLLFTGFTMYDFQRIKRYPENMYIEAALALYLDIFNLFLFILRLMMANRD